MIGKLNILNENRNNKAVDIMNEFIELGIKNLYKILKELALSNLAASITVLSIFIKPAK
jgi:hypothetical protein